MDCDGGACLDGVCQPAELGVTVDGPMGANKNTVAFVTKVPNEMGVPQMCFLGETGMPGSQPHCIDLGPADQSLTGTHVAVSSDGLAFYSPQHEEATTALVQRCDRSTASCTSITLPPANHLNGLLVIQDNVAAMPSEVLLGIEPQSGNVYRLGLSGSTSVPELLTGAFMAHLFDGHDLAYREIAGVGRLVINVLDVVTPCLIFVENESSKMLLSNGDVDETLCSVDQGPAKQILGVTVAPNGDVFARVFRMAQVSTVRYPWAGTSPVDVPGVPEVIEVNSVYSDPIASDQHFVYQYGSVGPGMQAHAIFACDTAPAIPDCMPITPPFSTAGTRKLALTTNHVFFTHDNKLFRVLKPPPPSQN